MFIITAHEHDADVLALQGTLGREAIRLLTPRSLSEPGWKINVNERDCVDNRIVVEGGVIPERAITGVLVRMRRVEAHELVWIHQDDRIYVASEMSAFLVAWLLALPCRVVGRPTPKSVAASWRSRWGWLLLAEESGIPVVRTLELGCKRATVSVIGEQVFGEVPGVPESWLVGLARTAGIDLLSATFAQIGEDWMLADVNVYPTLVPPDIPEYLLSLFA